MKRSELRLHNARLLVAEAGGIAEFAKRLGMSDSQASQIVGKSPTRGIGSAVGPRIEEAFGKSPGWLDQLHDEATEPTPVAEAVKDADITVIPHMNGRAKGGAGGLAPSHEYVIGSISVTNEWINRRLPSITGKRNLVVIEAYGRSMEPTLMSGDLLVVDTGVRDARIDGIYILQRMNTVEPEIMVKRLQRTLDGGLIVRSDNRAEYDPETFQAHEIADKVIIIGRVVWIWAGREG